MELIIEDRKIIGIGMNKTGTMSLTRALERLGITSIHDMQENREIHRLLEIGQRSRVLDDYDALIDGHWCYCLPKVFDLFPNSLFIHTTRDVEEWITSRLLHIAYNRTMGRTTWTEADTIKWQEQWEWHADMISRYWKSGFLHAGNYLKLNIIGGAGWEPLCNFLGKEIPDGRFPHYNTRRWRLRKGDSVRKAKDRRR